jgi:hypothetical protein
VFWRLTAYSEGVPSLVDRARHRRRADHQCLMPTAARLVEERHEWLEMAGSTE